MYFCVNLRELRYFLQFAYDGTDFSGMQYQPNAPSIQEELEKALSLILNEPQKITAAGRTDAGVHAKEMFAHFDTEKDVENLVYRLNRFLPKSISILNLYNVKPDAHARFDALSRTYEYFIHQRKNPFLDRFSVEFPQELDFEKMNEAAKFLIETEDFSSFEKMHSDNKTSICKVEQAQWEFIDDQWVFTIKADRFLRNMVRSVVGTLWEVGKGNISIEDFKQIIAKKDRKFAAASAPAKGLFLSKIEYPSTLFND